MSPLGVAHWKSKLVLKISCPPPRPEAKKSHLLRKWFFFGLRPANYKGGEILVLRKWRLWASSRKLFPFPSFFLLWNICDATTAIQTHFSPRCKKVPNIDFSVWGLKVHWGEAKDLSLLTIKFSAKCLGEVSNWLVMFTCGENLNETGEILIKS